jgi:hypothetical protein
MASQPIKVEFTVTYHDEGGLFSKATRVERTVTVDGDLLYSSKIAYPIYVMEESPLKDFENWLMGEEQAKRRCDIACNRSEGDNPVRHGWFKGFDFKKKFLVRNRSGRN